MEANIRRQNLLLQSQKRHSLQQGQLRKNQSSDISPLKQLIQFITPQQPVKKESNFLMISSLKLMAPENKNFQRYAFLFRNQKQNSQVIVRRKTECVSSRETKKQLPLPSLSPQKITRHQSQHISHEPDSKIISVRKKSVRFYEKVECQAVETQNGREYSVIKYLEPLNAE